MLTLNTTAPDGYTADYSLLPRAYAVVAYVFYWSNIADEWLRAVGTRFAVKYDETPNEAYQRVYGVPLLPNHRIFFKKPE